MFWSRAATNEGTLRNDTDWTTPAGIWAVASIWPAGVSIRITVSGASAGSMPVSSTTLVRAMMP